MPGVSYELQAKDEELLTLRVQHESFVREVGRAIHTDNLHSHEAVLDALRSYVRKQAGRSRHGADEEHGRRSQKNRGDHDEADYQKLKKRLSTALKTIESQDMWIDVLNRKVESLGGGGSAHTAGMQQEVRRMEQEVSHLKRQLSLKDSGVGRPGSSMPLYQNIFGVAGPSVMGGSLHAPNTVGPSDMLAFKSTIADLEARLQKHVEFRERVLEVLGLKVISASDDEILRHIRDAVAAARNASLSTSGLNAGGLNGLGGSLSSALPQYASTLRRSHSPNPNGGGYTATASRRY